MEYQNIVGFIYTWKSIMTDIQNKLQIMGLLFAGVYSYTKKFEMNMSRAILPDSLFGNCVIILQKVNCFDNIYSMPIIEKISDNYYISTLRINDTNNALNQILHQLLDIAKHIRYTGLEKKYLPDNIIERATQAIKMGV